MRILTLILVATMLSCASARKQRIAEYRKLTKDICKDNPNEIRLAQKFYITYVNNQ